MMVMMVMMILDADISDVQLFAARCV